MKPKKKMAEWLVYKCNLFVLWVKIWRKEKGFFRKLQFYGLIYDLIEFLKISIKTFAQVCSFVHRNLQWVIARTQAKFRIPSLTCRHCVSGTTTLPATVQTSGYVMPAKFGLLILIIGRLVCIINWSAAVLLMQCPLQVWTTSCYLFMVPISPTLRERHSEIHNAHQRSALADGSSGSTSFWWMAHTLKRHTACAKTGWRFILG